jgi:cell fate (sporulation/competence/biofilm development) regulator YlbF (YheA/YmcA/DUF963 family)
MPVETSQIVEAAEKLGKLIAEHPAIEKYRQAQKSLAEDPEASRLMGEFDQQLMTLAQQEQTGQPMSDNQRQRLESLQSMLASNLKVKAFSIAQYDLTDLLRKVSQAWQRPVAEAQGLGSRGGNGGGMSAGGGGGPRLVTGL